MTTTKNRTKNPSTPKQHVSNFNRLRRELGYTVSEYRAEFDISKTTFYRWRKQFSPASLKVTKRN